MPDSSSACRQSGCGKFLSAPAGSASKNSIEYEGVSSRQSSQEDERTEQGSARVQQGEELVWLGSWDASVGES